MSPSADAPEGAWGSPGSFLLPGALRAVLDDRPVPPIVASFLPALPATEPLRTARMPAGWALLPAVARRLVDFIRQEQLLDLRAVPDALQVPVPCPTATLDIDPDPGAAVVTRIVESAEGVDVDVLRRITLRQVLQAARNDAHAFLSAMTILDRMSADVPVRATDGCTGGEDRPDTSSAVLVVASRIERPPGKDSADGRLQFLTVADAVSAGGSVPLLNATQKATLRALPSRVWSEFVDELPVRVRNALLRTAGGPDGLRQYLATVAVKDLDGVRNFGSTSRAQLRSRLDELLDAAWPTAEITRPAEPVQQPEPESALRLPPDAALIRADDPRFRDLIAEAPDLTTAVAGLPVALGRELLIGVHNRRVQLAAQTIEEEGRALVAAAAGVPPGHVRATAMAARYGLCGTAPATMDEIGRMLGVTRARVGQISQRIARNLPAAPVWAPLADQLVQTVDSLLPCSTAELNETLQGAGLTELTWTTEALVAAAGLTGRELDLHEQDGFAARRDELPLVAAVWTTAHRISGRNGAASVEQVVSELVDPPGATEGLIRDLLTARTDITWLTRDWFWTSHAPRRNRLVNTSERILVVHQPQELSRMAGGVERNYTWRNSTGGASRAQELEVPPVDILRAFYASHPSFVTGHDGRIELARPVDADVLGAEKLTLVRILRERLWPAMTRNDLMEACVAEGMHASTAQIFLTYAECVENIGHNVWALRGAPVPPDVVLGLQDEARAKSKSFDREWREGRTAGGRPWFSQRITPTFMFSGVVISRWSANLGAESRLTIIDGTDGEPVGNLRRSGTFLYGLTQLLRKNKPAVGDFLRVTLYESDGYVVAELGQEELAEAPEDWT